MNDPTVDNTCDRCAGRPYTPTSFTLCKACLVIDDEPARWFDHWEDGASREYRGLREDDERLARERGTW